MYGHKKCPNVFEPLTVAHRNGLTIMCFGITKVVKNLNLQNKNTPAVIGEGAATLEMKWTAKSNKTKSGQF